AEDGIRDLIVTGVQTCALPISCESLGVAVSCTVCPSATLATAGLTVTETTGTVDLGAVDLSHETTNATATRTMWRTAMWRCMERSEEHTSELQSRSDLVCRLLP